MTPSARTSLDRVALIAGLLALWQAGSMLVGGFGLPSPAATLTHLGREMTTGWFWSNFEETVRALAAAGAIAIFGGVTLGGWLGVSRYAGEAAEPILTSLYSLPKITFYPLILLIFGIGFEAKVALGAIHGVIPVTLFTASAIRTIPPIYLRSGQAMGLSRVEITRTILLPAALPETLTGVRIGLSLTLLGTLIGEMFAAQAGLGFMLRQSMERVDGAAITALAVFLMVFALCLNAAMTALCRALGAPGMAALSHRSDRPR